MSALIDKIKSSLEGQIDFQGQKTTEVVSHFGLAGSAIVSFILGIVTKDLRVLLGAFGTGVLVTLMIVVPSWPGFNKHPVAWRSKIEVEEKKTN
ncbi:microsomal signal peptidase 12kDa subunit [Mrakia frigida]|uniref:signal peptidase complex subunit SPC1 n=1 Tax=Mrakia frigida TaxID=29902 RepID=UPI003FCBEFCF